MNMNVLSKFLTEASSLLEKVAAVDESAYTQRGDTKKSLFNDLKNLVNIYNSQVSEDQLEDERLVSLAARSRLLYNNYYSFIETAACLNIIIDEAHQFPGFNSNNDLLGDQEIKISKMNRDSHVVFVGSGPFPWSLIKYHFKTGCKAAGVDVKPEAVFLSHQLLITQKLADLIEIYCVDGREADYGPFTHVVLAAMSTPKDEIVRRVVSTAKKGTMLVVRRSFGLNCFFYERYIPSEISHLTHIREVRGDEQSELLSDIYLVD